MYWQANIAGNGMLIKAKYVTLNHSMHVCQHCHKMFRSEMLCVGITLGASVKLTAVANTVLIEL